ncbi:hypothetical protein [Aquimarina rubra]|uniref:Lipocalin-like domain-containing protein n=1 Tax=Aquimarina rubra TaxID=1920033 RepID=A0ABW5LHV4_9FLAO
MFSLLIIIFISNFSFSQSVEAVQDSLQGNWDLCKYMTSKHYCESNSSRLSCDYQLTFLENQFTLFIDSQKIDTGDFEIEHHQDDVFLITFDSSLNDEILKLLDNNTIKLFNKKEEGFALFIESTASLFVLKKTQQYLEN